MPIDNETRNRPSGDAARARTAAHGSAPTRHLGGRHDPGPAAGPGGGSPNIYHSSGDAIQRAGADAAAAAAALAADAPGIDKLRRMGLLSAWLDVAHAIGFDAFLVAWRTLSNHDALDGRGRIVVPLYTNFTRFERNEYVRSLLAAGKSDRDIIAAVKREFREILTPRSLRRIKRSPRMPA